MMQLKVKRKQNTALCAEFYKPSLKYSYQWHQGGRLRGSVQKQSAKLPLTQFNWLLDLYRNAFHDLNHSPQEHLRKNAISFSKSHVPCSFLPCKITKIVHIQKWYTLWIKKGCHGYLGELHKTSPWVHHPHVYARCAREEREIMDWSQTTALHQYCGLWAERTE